jgi:acetyl/propionyl-CoA carboxylase alpha subunit
VQGDAVSVFYDPMIAKVIVHGSDRTDAIHKLNSALSDTHIGGLPNNVKFVQQCLNHPEFVSGNVSTDFIVENNLLDAGAQAKPSQRSVLESVCARLLLQAHSQTNAIKGPFGNSAFFRLNHNARVKVSLSDTTKLDAVIVRDGSNIKSIRIGDDLEAKVSNVVYSLTDSTNLPHIQFVLEHNDQQWTVKAVQLKNSFAVSYFDNLLIFIV